MNIGLKNILCSGLCSLGHYCPAGSISPTSKECPIGRYGAINGLTNSSCSGICSAGYYCPSPTVATPCPAGTVILYQVIVRLIDYVMIFLPRLLQP